jgi:hypothetical protein
MGNDIISGDKRNMGGEKAFPINKVISHRSFICAMVASVLSLCFNQFNEDNTLSV